ncbi:MAG: BlaI/MecI/CopY family transcriptional regulator [Bdellovibrionales bacterium]
MKAKLLTETELELMNILWRLEEGSVADVMAALPSARPLAYTSVSTILRILEQKGILRSRKEGRGHIYIPKIKKAEYEARTIRHVVERVFDNTPSALVRQLLGSIEINETELAEIRALIDGAQAPK